MGGCAECGAALVRYSPLGPTDEQLINTMDVMGFGALATYLHTVPEHSELYQQIRTECMDIHGLVQRVASGDEQAAQELAIKQRTIETVESFLMHSFTKSILVSSLK
jgi:hypothetical protein